jgi:hypothetical protein
MRLVTAIPALLLAVLVAGLGYLVLQTAQGREDWLELVAIAFLAMVLLVTLHQRQVPAARRDRGFRRTPQSRW